MKEQVYVVTGATGGIGQVLARRLKQAGGKLYLSARNKAKLLPLAEELDAIPLLLDSTDPSAVAETCQIIKKTTGQISGLAHCVGSLLLKPAHLTKTEEWMGTLATNLSSAFFWLKGSINLMDTGEGGSIVLVSSAAARLGLAHHEAIASAKAGLHGLAISAAATYANKNIRINVVAPGLVESPLTEQLLSNPRIKEESVKKHALKHLGTPDDVASALLWLLHPEQKWVTGQIIGVDGGLASIMAKGV